MSASIAAGVYLNRYKTGVTEMLGMMIGMTQGMMTGITIGSAFFWVLQRKCLTATCWA